MTSPLKLGVSACFFHADPSRPIFTGKTLQYVEQSVVQWVMSQGDLAVMVPAPEPAARLGEYAQWLDGLVLMGGSDVCPATYGETALQPQWNGDRVRDERQRRGEPHAGLPAHLGAEHALGALHQRQQPGPDRPGVRRVRSGIRHRRTWSSNHRGRWDRASSRSRTAIHPAGWRAGTRATSCAGRGRCG